MKLNHPIEFICGASMKNKFMLAPLTNTQSHPDGTLSEDEFNWLSKRAEGQFGLVMTCASHVQKEGQGFPGQLGIYADKHMEGHRRLAAKIKSEGSLALVQLHHAGMRSPADMIGQKPLCPSDNEKYGARGLDLNEITQLRGDFLEAAKRAKACGYDGVEIHGAHGYILTQFLSAEINKRKDHYGGSLENRKRLLFEIVDDVRSACGSNFLLGVRLSPERFGMKLSEVKEVFKSLVDTGQIDFIDVSLWDSFKMPEEESEQSKSLLKHFTDIDRKDVKLTVAGKIRDGSDVVQVLHEEVDFVSIGRSAILHYDFPVQVMRNKNFKSKTNPVSREYLKSQSVGSKFITYLSKWPGFVSDE